MLNIVKPILALCFIAGVSTVNASVDETPSMSPEMETFLQSSLFLNQGIKSQDESLLADAAEGFSSIEIEELSNEDFSVETSTPLLLLNPEVLYNDIFCDDIRLNQFILIEREPLLASRILGDDDVISTVSRSLLPGGEVTFNFEGEGLKEVALIQYIPEGLVMEIFSKSSQPQIVRDNNSGFLTSIFSLDSSESFNVKILNPSSEKVSFCVAIK